MSKPVLFIFGLGYVGQHLGASLMSQGWHVIGTTRTATQVKILKDKGFEAIFWDGTHPLPPLVLDQATHILITIPPDEKGDSVVGQIDGTSTSLKWVGYLSATSVYGDHQGAWVHENSSLKPQSIRGKQRFLAETQWIEKWDQDPTFAIHIFRLSGIYGPGRSVLNKIRSGTAQRIDKPGHVFSRIHIEDIVRVLTASMLSPNPGEVYNLADDQPAALSDVIATGCKLLGVKVPPLIPFEDGAISPMLREFFADHKRVSNNKMKRDFGIRLTYPSYEEGLKCC